MSMDNRYLYVTNNGRSTVSVIDLNTTSLIQSVAVPAKPEGIEVGVGRPRVDCNPGQRYREFEQHAPDLRPDSAAGAASGRGSVSSSTGYADRLANCSNAPDDDLLAASCCAPRTATLSSASAW